MPPVRAIPMLAMSQLASPAPSAAASVPRGSQSPGKPYSSSPPKKGHARARSSSGSSSTSSSGSASRTVPSFPMLLPTSESVLEQDASDILWKTFVAFEQDCRDHSALLPLLPSIEQTVASAIDPISLAAECLEETSSYLDGDVREAIEHALAAPGPDTPGSGSGSPRPQISSPISHSKQFSLASTRLSSACSTFRATQANLRYYGGAKKTAYQLDLFVHKYALPTSTALHKRGQEVSAAMKWLKKMLNHNDGRTLDPLELACLRRASVSLKAWAEGLKIHSQILRAAANAVKALMLDRAQLQAYSFPPKSPMKFPASLPTGVPGSAALLSPLSKYTNIALMPSPTGLPQTSNYLSGDVPLWAAEAQSGIFPSSSAEAQVSMPMMMSLPAGSVTVPMPLPSTSQSVPTTLPQSCAFNLVSSPSPSHVQLQSQGQAQLLPSGDIFAHHHQQQQEQNYYAAPVAPAQQYQQQQYQPQMYTQQQQNAFAVPSSGAGDLGLPADFFDNLCV